MKFTSVFWFSASRTKKLWSVFTGCLCTTVGDPGLFHKLEFQMLSFFSERDVGRLMKEYPFNRFLWRTVPKPFQIVFVKQVKKHGLEPVSTRVRELGHVSMPRNLLIPVGGYKLCPKIRPAYQNEMDLLFYGVLGILKLTHLAEYVEDWISSCI